LFCLFVGLKEGGVGLSVGLCTGALVVGLVDGFGEVVCGVVEVVGR